MKTETMCIDALHKAYTVKSNVCLFACPYEIQVRKIFERLNELINESPALKKEIVSNTKSPFQITLKNGSSIKGFTTGAASGGGADNIRGQRADFRFFICPRNTTNTLCDKHN